MHSGFCRIIVMPTLVVLLGFIALFHLVLHLPLALAAIITLVLWLIWKLKYLILAIIGIEWLLDRDR